MHECEWWCSWNGVQQLIRANGKRGARKSRITHLPFTRMQYFLHHKIAIQSIFIMYIVMRWSRLRFVITPILQQFVAHNLVTFRFTLNCAFISISMRIGRLVGIERIRSILTSTESGHYSSP